MDHLVSAFGIIVMVLAFGLGWCLYALGLGIGSAMDRAQIRIVIHKHVGVNGLPSKENQE